MISLVKSIRAGAAGLLALLLVAGMFLSVTPGCKPTPIPLHDFIECSTLEAPKLEAEGKALFNEFLANGWAAAESKAESDILTSGADIVGCAFAMITQQYLSAHKSADPAQTWPAHDELEKLRAKISPPNKLVGFKFGNEIL